MRVLPLKAISFASVMYWAKNFLILRLIPKFLGKRVTCTQILLILFFMFGAKKANAQVKRIVVLGSSTAAGVGASPHDSCWVRLLNHQYKCRLDVVDTIFNLGIPGTTLYQAMPSDYVAPQGRPTPDTAHNVNKALYLLQDLTNPADGVVIINYPTNGYTYYTTEEILLGLQTIFDSITTAGNKCYITTTQPRNDATFDNSTVKNKLAVIKDSINNRFGDCSLNFWDGMFNAADTTILTEFNCGDNIHFNNAGYNELFNRIFAKDIFKLPVWYAKDTGYLNELTTWGKNPDGSGDNPTSFEADNQTFHVVNNPTPTVSANWLLSGKNTALIIGDGTKLVDFIIPEGIEVRVNRIVTGGCD